MYKHDPNTRRIFISLLLLLFVEAKVDPSRDCCKQEGPKNYNTNSERLAEMGSQWHPVPYLKQFCQELGNK